MCLHGDEHSTKVRYGLNYSIHNNHRDRVQKGWKYWREVERQTMLHFHHFWPERSPHRSGLHPEHPSWMHPSLPNTHTHQHCHAGILELPLYSFAIMRLSVQSRCTNCNSHDLTSQLRTFWINAAILSKHAFTACSAWTRYLLHSCPRLSVRGWFD